MPNYGRYPAELRERAVRMVLDHEREHGSRWEAICSVAHELGPSAESVRKRVRQAEIDAGGREGVTAAERERVKVLEREVRELRRGQRDPQGGVGFLRGGARPPVPQTAAFVDAHRDRFGVEPICTVLTEHGVGIAPSAYCAAEARLPSARDRRDEFLCEVIARAHRDNCGVCGAVKAWEHLNRVERARVARCTVERLMGRLGPAGVRRGRRPSTATGSESDDRPADLVRRDFAAPAPDRLWLADLTYVRTRSGFVYVSFVIDAFSRRVPGRRPSRSLRTGLALDASQMAVHTRQRTGRSIEGVTHHSDRGSQYLSIRCSQRLADNDIAASVGSKGDSYDNAMTESLNGLFKWEPVYPEGPWQAQSDVEYATLEWVDWHNRRRLHSRLTGTPRHTTPAEHENAHYSQTHTANEAATHKKQSLPNPA